MTARLIVVTKLKCSGDSEVVGEGLEWVCKIAGFSLERICRLRDMLDIESDKRIKNSKVIEMLEQRYPSINIYDHDN